MNRTGAPRDSVKFYRSPHGSIRDRALFEARRWALRTTIVGLPNLLAAPTFRRRLAWSVVLVAVSGIGLFHLVMSVRNFLNSGMKSQMAVDAAPAEFPSVTICSLKPASESLLKYYGGVVHRHLDHHWGYFDNWFLHERRQGVTETELDYRNRVRKVFLQMLEVLWVSDDTRDLGLLDRISILDCAFNGIHCDHTNFSLVQHHSYWNCYMFSPHSSHRFSSPSGEHNAGLTMSIFTDSNFFDSAYQSKQMYKAQTGQDYRVNGTSLRQFLTEQAGEIHLNSILDVEDFQTDGIQVILHPWNRYPLFPDQQRFTVQNSMAAVHQVSATEQRKISTPGSPCTKQPLGTIDYVVTFGSEPTDTLRRSFAKGGSDLFYLKVQDEIHRHCFCYSHRVPFRVDKSQLCYYAPPSQRKAPAREQLMRIYCHDVWIRRTIGRGDLADAFAKAAKEQLTPPCRRAHREVQAKSTKWPSEEDLIPATILYLVDRFTDGYGSRTSGEVSSSHRIFNFSDPQVRAALPPGQEIISRENVTLRSLTKPHCGQNYWDESRIAETVTCLLTEVARRNVLKVNVRLTSPGAIVYTDLYTYVFDELLSEFGGVLGLWFGVSVLTFFELIELLYLVFFARPRLIVRQSDSLDSVRKAL